MPAKRLLSDIVSLTPSNYDDFTRCPRLFYCNALLGLPASDPAPSTDQGLLVHDMLRKIHADGECYDGDHVADVLVAHGFDTPAVRDMVARHADRCPSRHRGRRARGRRRPVPPRCRRRCSWRPRASTRCGSTTASSTRATTRPAGSGSTPSPRSRRRTCRPSCWPRAPAPAATACGCATSTCSRRSTRIPEPWELDDEALAAVEEELRAAVERMWLQDEWRGVAEIDVCRTCRYRSICRDSAAPGEPAWPVLSTDPTEPDR